MAWPSASPRWRTSCSSTSWDRTRSPKSICRTTPSRAPSRITVSHDDPPEGCANPRRQRRWPARLPVYEDVNEVAGRRRLVVAVAEDTDLITHAAVAEVSDAQTRVDGARERERLVKPAQRLDRQTDDGPIRDV